MEVKQMKKKLFIVIAVCLSVYVFATGSQDSSASSTNGSQGVKIENFNHTSVYTKAPERVVAVTLAEAELLAALDLQSKMIGLDTGHSTLKDLLPESQKKLKNVPIINSNVKNVSIETIIKHNPDFLFTRGYRFNVPSYGKVEDYNKNGVNVYVSEGTYVPNASIKNTYNDILNLGKIFRIETRAEKLIQKLQKRENAVIKKLKGVKPVKCFILAGDNKNRLFTAGGNALQSSIITKAGGKNIFGDVKKQFLPASLEQIISANPDVIIINAFPIAEGGKHYANDGERKIKLLKSMKELSEVSAIKNNRFIIVPLISLFPGIQNINALENIAKELHPDRF